MCQALWGWASEGEGWRSVFFAIFEIFPIFPQVFRDCFSLVHFACLLVPCVPCAGGDTITGAIHDVARVYCLLWTDRRASPWPPNLRHMQRSCHTPGRLRIWGSGYWSAQARHTCQDGSTTGIPGVQITNVEMDVKWIW